MSDPAAAPAPTICLNMIVRNEAHIVREVLDSVAPYISSWVIVDTGSGDGTQDIIERHMAGLGIAGELHERAWVNFGHNRSEALSLAQGHSDYIWVMDADDLVVGSLDFGELGADAYELRYGRDFIYWRRQLFRSGLPWHYKGVVHEYADCEREFVEQRLDGDYFIESRRLGARNLDPQKYARDRDLLLAEVAKNPDDKRSVFYLAQSYYDLGDYVNARSWYGRRVELGGWDEEIYIAALRMAYSMSELGVHWPDVQHTFLRAYEFRPTRAEALHAIAHRYRIDSRFQLGYLFAERAAQIPLPEQDRLFVSADIYNWKARDEQAVCASWLGKHAEAFTLCRANLARTDLADSDRRRIAGNRDLSVPAMLDASSRYPDVAARQLLSPAGDADVTVSLVAGPDRVATEATLNSFLHCCLDSERIGRVLILAAGLSADDHANLVEHYGFLDFIHTAPTAGLAAHLAQIRAHIDKRFWLHLGAGWRFFAPEKLISRLITILHTHPEVVQVAINLDDATTLTGTCAPDSIINRSPGAGRYVLTDTPANGPAIYDTTRLDKAGGFNPADHDPINQLAHRLAEAAMRCATLDEVLAVGGN